MLGVVRISAFVFFLVDLGRCLLGCSCFYRLLFWRLFSVFGCVVCSLSVGSDWSSGAFKSYRFSLPGSSVICNSVLVVVPLRLLLSCYGSVLALCWLFPRFVSSSCSSVPLLFPHSLWVMPRCQSH